MAVGVDAGVVAAVAEVGRRWCWYLSAPHFSRPVRAAPFLPEAAFRRRRRAREVRSACAARRSTADPENGRGLAEGSWARRIPGGPITVGLGGVLAEIYKDASTASCLSTRRKRGR